MSRLDSVEDLVRAFAARDLETIRALADAGLDLDALGGGGLTPLMRVVLRRDAVAVEWILAAGANPDARTADGKTALDFARQLETHNFGFEDPAIDLAQLLIAAGATAESVDVEAAWQAQPTTDSPTVLTRSPSARVSSASSLVETPALRPGRRRTAFCDSRSDRWPDAFEDRFEEQSMSQRTRWRR